MFTHSNFQNIEYGLSRFRQKFQKFESNFSFSCQNSKLELSIDMLIISGSMRNLTAIVAQKQFCKISKKCSQSALLNFASTCLWVNTYDLILDFQDIRLYKMVISFSYFKMLNFQYFFLYCTIVLYGRGVLYVA